MAKQNQRGKLSSNFLVLFLIFIISSVVVYADYTQIGTVDKNFHIEGRGLFTRNLNSDDVIKYSIGFNDFVFEGVPLIYDYDNDSYKEFIFGDNKDIIIYNFTNSQFNLEKGYNHYYQISEIQKYENYLLIEDLNDDDTPLGVSVYKNNGTDFNFVYNHSIPDDILSASGFNSQLNYGCFVEENDMCIMVYGHGDDNSMKAAAFKINSTNNYNNIIVLTDGVGSGVYFMPSAHNLQYDSPSSSIWFNARRSSTYMYFYELGVNSSNEVYEKSYFTDDRMDGYNTEGINLKGRDEDMYTNIILSDINGITGNEIIIAGNENENEFKIFTFELDGSIIDDYPEVFQADGQVISNIVMADVFPDHNNNLKDFCVLGYQRDLNPDYNMDLLCASELTSESIFGTGNSAEFFTTTNNTEVSSSISLGKTIHSTQHSTQTVDGRDLSEFLTPFGVYSIPENNTLTPIFEIDKPSLGGYLIDNDFSGVGLKDLIYTTQNNIFLYEDGYINTGAEIDGYVINPCIDSVWKQNTTVGIKITPVDTNGGGGVSQDDVRARAILYYNHANENVTKDSNWSAYYSSGTEIQFSFSADTKVTNGQIRLMATDEVNPDTIDTIDLSFSVANDGVEFGDCSTSVEGLVTEEAEIATQANVTLADNELTNLADEIEIVTGVPFIILFLATLLMVDLIIFTSLISQPLVALWSVIIIDFTSFVLATLMGWFGIAFTITFYALFIIIGVGYIMHIVNKSTGAG